MEGNRKGGGGGQVGGAEITTIGSAKVNGLAQSGYVVDTSHSGGGAAATRASQLTTSPRTRAKNGKTMRMEVVREMTGG